MAELWQTLIDNSGGVVAVFTIVLAVTTIMYVIVSGKLLKQSQKALLADIVLRLMGMFRVEIREIEKRVKREGKIKLDVFIKGWMEGYCKTFVKIDKKLGMDIIKLLKVDLETTLKEWEKGEKELREKEEETKK